MSKRIEGRRWGRQRRPAQGETTGTGAAASQPAATSFWRSGRLWLILFLCLVGSTVASYVVFKYVMVKVPPELVGTWQVTKGPFKGWTLELHSDGTAIGTEYRPGQKVVLNQTVEVDGKSIVLTNTNMDEKTGKNDTATLTILELTGDTLVIRHEDQTTYHMKRIAN